MRQLLDTLAEVKDAGDTRTPSEEKPVKPVKPAKGGKPQNVTSPAKASPHVPRIIRKVSLCAHLNTLA